MLYVFLCHCYINFTCSRPVSRKRQWSTWWKWASPGNMALGEEGLSWGQWCGKCTWMTSCIYFLTFDYLKLETRCFRLNYLNEIIVLQDYIVHECAPQFSSNGLESGTPSTIWLGRQASLINHWCNLWIRDLISILKLDRMGDPWWFLSICSGGLSTVHDGTRS